MNRLHPIKLLNTKWTAVLPVNKEKHFIVTRVIYPDSPDEQVERLEIEAVYSRFIKSIAWEELRNTKIWKRGWV
jgi:tryptophan-rich hypothetical protein